MQAAVT